MITDDHGHPIAPGCLVTHQGRRARVLRAGHYYTRIKMGTNGTGDERKVSTCDLLVIPEKEESKP